MMEKHENGFPVQEAEEHAAEIPAEVRWYHGVSLEEAELYIRANLKFAVRNVIATGYYLKCVRDGELYREAGFESIWEYAEETFGFSASTTSRYMKRNDKFSVDGNSPILDEKYRDFNKSQLQEMLGFNEEQLEQVTPDMTVQQIREIRKPKEIPYVELPGQIALSDFPGITPEEAEAVSGEAETLNPEQAETGQTEVFTVATEELLPEEEGVAISQLPVAEDRSGSCLYRPENLCTLTDGDKYQPGTGEDCIHHCCWNCIRHGECRMECNSSAGRPESLKEGEKTVAEEAACTNEFPEEAQEPSEIEQTEYETPPTDLELLKDLLSRNKRLLESFLKSGAEENDEHIRKQKLLVGALASMVTELEGIPEPEKAEQPELPRLKNNEQRAAFVDAYETWPLWIDNRETGERYYRYDLPDGTSMVIKTYHTMRIYDWKAGEGARYREGYGCNEQYLLEPGKLFRDCQANRSVLIEKLKEMQKGEKGRCVEV